MFSSVKKINKGKAVSLYFLRKIFANKIKKIWSLFQIYKFKQKGEKKRPVFYSQLGSLNLRKQKLLLLLNKKGQGLVEYLILVALMGVATVGIIRTLNQTVKTRFANAIYALQGRNQKAKTHVMRKEEYQRSDLSNFMSGAASTDNKKKKKRK